MSLTEVNMVQDTGIYRSMRFLIIINTFMYKASDAILKKKKKK